MHPAFYRRGCDLFSGKWFYGWFADHHLRSRDRRGTFDHFDESLPGQCASRGVDDGYAIRLRHRGRRYA